MKLNSQIDEFYNRYQKTYENNSMESIMRFYFGDEMNVIGQMTATKYQELAMRTCGVEEKNDMLLNGAIGLSGETGEVADIIKKYIYHHKELNINELIAELGDVMWYLAEIATAIGTDFETIFWKNIEKLKKRYPNGFPKNWQIIKIII